MDLATYEPKMLDVYNDEGFTSPAGPNIIATISAGRKVTKNGKTYPEVSRDGKIILHDGENPEACRGIREALQASKYQSLTIAFPFDDDTSIYQQQLVRYGFELVRGDESGLHVVKKSRDVKQDEHEFEYSRVERLLDYKTKQTESYSRLNFPADSEPFKRERQHPDLKVETQVFFVLAGWDGDIPIILFPDSANQLYRLRFNSRNSAMNLSNTLKHLRRITGGSVAGIPLEVSLSKANVPDGTGMRRSVPVWSFNLKPPQTLALTSSTFRGVLEQGLNAGRQLMLEAPSIPTELALEDDITEADFKRLESQLTPEVMASNIALMLQGTPFEENYRELLYALTGFESIKDWSQQATSEDYEQLLHGLEEALRSEALRQDLESMAKEGRAYAAMFDFALAPVQLEALQQALDATKLEPSVYGDLIRFIAGLKPRSEVKLSVKAFHALLAKFGEWNGETLSIKEGNLAEVLLDFNEARSSKEHLLEAYA